MRELLIKIKAILEGAGLKDAAQQQRDVAKATQEATRAAEQQARTTTSQATPADQAASKAKDELAKNTKKAATSFEDVKRAGGPATQILSGLQRAAHGGAQGVMGLVDVVKGMIATFAGGFGTGGIIAVASAVIGGLALAFGEKLIPKAKDATKEIDATSDAIDRLNQANIDQINDRLGDLNAGSDARIENLKLELDLRRQILAASTAAQVAEINARPDLTKDKKAEQVAAVQLNQRLAEANSAVERAAIARAAADERVANQAKQIADLQAQRLADLQKLAADETARARVEAEIPKLQARLDELRSLRVGSNARGPSALGPSAEEIDLQAQLEAAKQFLKTFGGEIGQADADARRKALEQLDTQIHASSRKLTDLKSAAANAAAAIDKITKATGSVAQPGTIKGEVAREAGAGQIARDTAAARAHIAEVEKQRRAQADREIEEEVKRRAGIAAPDVPLPAEASRPGSGFDVRKWNADRISRWRSAADLREVEDAMRAAFDEAIRDGTIPSARPESPPRSSRTPAQEREEEIRSRREHRFDAIDPQRSQPEDLSQFGTEAGNAMAVPVSEAVASKLAAAGDQLSQSIAAAIGSKAFAESLADALTKNIRMI